MTTSGRPGSPLTRAANSAPAARNVDTTARLSQPPESPTEFLSHNGIAALMWRSSEDRASSRQSLDDSALERTHVDSTSCLVLVRPFESRCSCVPGSKNRILL